MASSRPQTQAKRARELAVKERREQKLAKKLARAAERRGETEGSPLETAPDGETAA